MRGRFARHWVWAAALAVLLSCGVGYAVYRQSLTQSLDDTARRGENVLQLAATALSGQLERFERLPPLIADQAMVLEVASAPRDPAVVARANAYLARIQVQLGASDIYVIDPQGLTVAASNHATATSFIGGNFAFRPYFYDAIRGGVGRFYALGTTSRKRGYYFGAPITVAGRIAGVLAVKIDLDAVEDTWRSGDYAVLVTDPDGVIFLSSRADWRFRAMRPLSIASQSRLTATRRYADAPIGLLDVRADVVQGGHHLLTVADGSTVQEYVQRDLPMVDAGWQVHVLIDTVGARRSALTSAVVAMLLIGLLALLGVILWQRRLALAERLQMQQATRADLEARVAARTEELAGVNRLLEAEVAERRRAQADLIQAGKLAALGQMSAALSHEFNQPLAAARTYADNAGVLMDRGRMAEARSNITRILGLIDRMTAISRHLRSFARKPGQRLSAVRLADVVEAAEEIALLRTKAARAELSVVLAPDVPQVIAGPVRLQQVLVNLLTNAADAVEGQEDRRISLRARAEGRNVVLEIEDSGPGVPPGLAERIFDPFFSTKGVGKGLGLGLSISYNIIKDFGGDIAVSSSPMGGALFTIRLRVAEADSLPGAAA